jgi:hypothetical protein
MLSVERHEQDALIRTARCMELSTFSRLRIVGGRQKIASGPTTSEAISDDVANGSRQRGENDDAQLFSCESNPNTFPELIELAFV